MDAPVTEAPAVPAEAPAAAPIEQPKTLNEAGKSAFERMSKLNSEPKEPAAEDPKPEDTPDDKIPNDNGNGNGKVSEEVKKMLDEMLAKGEYLPKHRFDEVLTRAKAFERFGTPEQIQAALDKAKDLNKLPDDPKLDIPDAELTAEELEIKNGVLKLFPFLKDIPKTQTELKELKTEHETRTKQEQEQAAAKEQALFRQGEDKIKALCEKAGLPVSAEQLEDHIAGVTRRLYANPEMAKRFHAGDVEALNTVFDKYFNDVFSGFQRTAKAELLKGKNNKEALPKPPASGAPPVPEPEKPAKTLGQAADRAWDRLRKKA